MEPIFFILQALLDFVFYYPLFMAYLWMVGGLDYYLRREYRKAGPGEPPRLSSYPLVSIIVPCHNEAEHLHDTIGYLFHQQYPDYEIIAVNDGSTDETGRMLADMAQENPRLRVVHFETNQGKAMGLRMASLVARGNSWFVSMATHCWIPMRSFG